MDYMAIEGSLSNSWNQVWSSFLYVVPQVVIAILLFVFGTYVARWVRNLVVGVLKAVKLEEASKKIGLESVFKKFDHKVGLTESIGLVVYWLIMLVFFLAVSDYLGLSVVSSVLAQILSYIPNIVAAALIFGLGYFVAGLVENGVRGMFSSVDSKIAKPVSKFARGMFLVISFFAALDQLQIAQALIATFYQGLTYTVVLAVGLSVGLGAKDLVSEILNDWYKKVSK